MRTIAGICATLVVCGAVRSQSVGSFETFLRDSAGADSLRFFVEEGAFFKLTTQRPLVLQQRTKSGVTFIDEKPKHLRFQFLGRQTFTLFPRKQISRDLQPHAFLELTGLATYMSIRAGAGMTFRSLGTSVGFASATYLKRTNEVADVTYRAKAFEQAVSYGGYIHSNQEYLFWFASVYWEKRGFYYRAEFGYKPGAIFDAPMLRVMRVLIKSETFLGTGGGIAYCHPSGRFDLSCVYSAPEGGERQKQRPFGNHIGRGCEFSLKVRWF